MSRATKTGRELSIPGAPDPQPIDGGVVLVKVQALGASRIVVGRQVIGPTAGMLLSLLLRLIYAPGCAVSRDTLLAELWPEQPAARQRGNLRQALYKLRSYGVRVALVSGSVRFDRRQLDRTLSVERTSELFERDVTRGSDPFGTFLPGYVAPSDAWQRAMEEVREVVHGDLRRVLVEQLRMRRERVDWGGAAVLSRWLLQFDPLNEDATLAMAECTMLSGAKAEAVAILDRYLAELGPHAGDIRLPAALLRRRFTEPPIRRRPSLASTERHFVGREQELADLSLAMRRARWHDGSAVLLHGPPGIGKTRLCAELGKVATIEGYREVSMECRETDQQRPLAVILDALPVLLSAPGALGSAPESLTVLRRLVGEEVPEPAEPVEEPLAPTIAEEAGAALSATERYERTMRTVRTQSIRHAIIDLVAAVSDERPIFMVVDDAHWLDDASWDVLTDLIQRVGSMRLFMVLTSRFGTLRVERPARMPEKLVARRIPGLSDEECVRLARAIGEDLSAHPTAEVEAWLVRGSEGTPLMLRALVDHWIITGEAIGIPPTLAHLLVQRLHRLSQTSLRALQSITLLNKHASLDRVKESLQLPTHELLSAFEQLVETGCLASDDASLLIVHDLLGRMAHEKMPSIIESALRASIAAALEVEYQATGNTEILLEALQHTERSARPDALRRFVGRHTEALIRSGRPTVVINSTRALLSRSTSSPADRELRRLHARLEAENGSFGQALALLPGGLSLPISLEGLSTSDLDDCLSFVESAYRSDPIANPYELGAFAAASASDARFPLEYRLRAADIGLVISSNTCDEKTAHECYFGLQISESEMSRRAETQRIGLIYHTVFGTIDRANSLASMVFDQSSNVGATTTSIADLGRAGYVFRMTGQHEQAICSLLKARAMANEIGSPRLAEYPVWQLAQIFNERGEADKADRWTEEFQTLTVSHDEPVATDYVSGHLCLMAIGRADNERAALHLSNLQDRMPRFPALRTAAYCLALELGVGLLDPEWIPPAPLVEVALDRFEKTKARAGADLLAATVGASLYRLGEKEEACRLVSEYLTRHRRERSSPSAMLRALEAKLSVESAH